ncbi:hypothetical protein JCM33374_g5452 [Metschnikowia sp. JCM 33374]|nr:hypothetical protein JCM33374_g5452 [Metschnikowia sp. JCM 33374]
MKNLKKNSGSEPETSPSVLETAEAKKTTKPSRFNLGAKLRKHSKRTFSKGNQCSEANSTYFYSSKSFTFSRETPTKMATKTATTTTNDLKDHTNPILTKVSYLSNFASGGKDKDKNFEKISVLDSRPLEGVQIPSRTFPAGQILETETMGASPEGSGMDDKNGIPVPEFALERDFSQTAFPFQTQTKEFKVVITEESKEHTGRRKSQEAVFNCADSNEDGAYVFTEGLRQKSKRLWEKMRNVGKSIQKASRKIVGRGKSDRAKLEISAKTYEKGKEGESTTQSMLLKTSLDKKMANNNNFSEQALVQGRGWEEIDEESQKKQSQTCEFCKSGGSGALGMGDCPTCYYYWKEMRGTYIKYDDLARCKSTFDPQMDSWWKRPMTSEIHPFASMCDSFHSTKGASDYGFWRLLFRSLHDDLLTRKMFRRSQKVHVVARSTTFVEYPCRVQGYFDDYEGEYDCTSENYSAVVADSDLGGEAESILELAVSREEQVPDTVPLVIIENNKESQGSESETEDPESIRTLKDGEELQELGVSGESPGAKEGLQMVEINTSGWEVVRFSTYMPTVNTDPWVSPLFPIHPYLDLNLPIDGDVEMKNQGNRGIKGPSEDAEATINMRNSISGNSKESTQITSPNSYTVEDNTVEKIFINLLSTESLTETRSATRELDLTLLQYCERSLEGEGGSSIEATEEFTSMANDSLMASCDVTLKLLEIAHSDEWRLSQHITDMQRQENFSPPISKSGNLNGISVLDFEGENMLSGGPPNTEEESFGPQSLTSPTSEEEQGFMKEPSLVGRLSIPVETSKASYEEEILEDSHFFCISEDPVKSVEPLLHHDDIESEKHFQSTEVSNTVESVQAVEKEIIVKEKGEEVKPIEAVSNVDVFLIAEDPCRKVSNFSSLNNKTNVFYADTMESERDTNKKEYQVITNNGEGVEVKTEFEECEISNPAMDFEFKQESSKDYEEKEKNECYQLVIKPGSVPKIEEKNTLLYTLNLAEMEDWEILIDEFLQGEDLSIVYEAKRSLSSLPSMNFTILQNANSGGSNDYGFNSQRMKKITFSPQLEASATKMAPSKSILKKPKHPNIEDPGLFKTFKQPYSKEERENMEDEMFQKLEDCRDALFNFTGKHELSSLQDPLDLFILCFSFALNNYVRVAKKQFLDYYQHLSDIHHTLASALVLLCGAGERFSLLVEFIGTTEKSEESLLEVQERTASLMSFIESSDKVLQKAQNALTQLIHEDFDYANTLYQLIDTAKDSYYDISDFYKLFLLYFVEDTAEKQHAGAITGYDILEEESEILDKVTANYDISKLTIILNEYQTSCDTLSKTRKDLETRTQQIMTGVGKLKRGVSTGVRVSSIEEADIL